MVKSDFLQMPFCQTCSSHPQYMYLFCTNSLFKAVKKHFRNIYFFDIQYYKLASHHNKQFSLTFLYMLEWFLTWSGNTCRICWQDSSAADTGMNSKGSSSKSVSSEVLSAEQIIMQAWIQFCSTHLFFLEMYPMSNFNF